MTRYDTPVGQFGDLVVRFALLDDLINEFQVFAGFLLGETARRDAEFDDLSQ